MLRTDEEVRLSKKDEKRSGKANCKWYEGGLAFECQQSGNCCSGEPGYVWVTKAEIRAIARYLGRTDDWLSKEHLRRVALRYSLTEQPDGDCIFLARKDGGTYCKINEVKPTQCRTWPFWRCNLESPDDWNMAAQKCPGMNRGRLHSLSEIEAQLNMKAPT